MTAGRQFGSSMTSVSAASAARSPAASAEAIGSSTSPSVPRWNAARPGRQGGARRRPRPSRGAEVSAVWKRYVAAPRVVEFGDGQGRRRVGRRGQRQVDAVARQRVAQDRRRTGRSTGSRGRRPSPPSRAIVRAVLNGPPPGIAASRPSGWTSRSMRASPATTIMGAMVRARRTLAERWTAAPTPPNCSTARWTTPRRWPATCATCGGSIAGSAASALSRRRDRGAGRASRRAHPARRRDRRRRHPGRAPRAGRGARAAAGRSSRSTAGRRSWPRPSSPGPALATTDGLELHVGDGRSLPYPDRSFDVAHASLVVHHCTPDEAVALLREMARVARLGVVVNDLDREPARLDRRVAARPPADAATGTRATTRRCRSRRAYRADEMAAMLRTAGLTPVRTVRGSLGQRYAIAALPTPGRGRRIRRRRPTRTGRGRVTASERVEVAIVGGGPAGAVLAARLARARASRSSSSSGRPPGTGGPAASSRRRPRSRRSSGPGWTPRRSPRSPGRSPRCASRRRPGRRSG